MKVVEKETTAANKPTVEVNRNTKEATKNTEEVRRNTVEVNKNTSEVNKMQLRNTVEVRRSTAEVNTNTVEVARNTGKGNKNTVEVSKRRRPLKNANTARARHNTVEVRQRTKERSKHATEVSKGRPRERAHLEETEIPKLRAKVLDRIERCYAESTKGSMASVVRRMDEFHALAKKFDPTISGYHRNICQVNNGREGVSCSAASSSQSNRAAGQVCIRQHRSNVKGVVKSGNVQRKNVGAEEAKRVLELTCCLRHSECSLVAVRGTDTPLCILDSSVGLARDPSAL